MEQRRRLEELGLDPAVLAAAQAAVAGGRAAPVDDGMQEGATVQGAEQMGFTPSAQPAPAKRMTQERINKALQTLLRYKAGKSRLEARLVEVEQWWKLRHWEWMQEKGAKDDMKTASAWLFNVIVSKHADGVQSIPEANVLPREEQDKLTAKTLSSIIPCVLEQNRYDEVYSDVLRQKLKGGTGAYGCFWDSAAHNGLGDIAIRRVNLLHLFWEPGVSDIQHSQNVFHVEMVDRELLVQQYPQLDGEKLTSGAVVLRKFMTEDVQDNEDKVAVVDWYYHTYYGGRKALHFCKFVNDNVLFCSEDDPNMAERGLYDHCRYPFVLDALFPVEGSPCGFGYIDVCKSAQEQIDILNQAVIKNALVNAIPRYFVRADGSVNEDEFMDFTRPLVHVNGAMSTDSLIPLAAPALNGNCIAVMENKIGELKETSGNTDSSNGISQGSSQAASAIAALQEASGKVSRASTLSAYRAFCRLVDMVIELIRQFYDVPRQFRIVGEMGQEQFMQFDNAMMQPQIQPGLPGVDVGLRLPVFDVKVSAQTRNAYSKNSQNELALTLYSQGVFNPQMADQALMLLDMMDFDDKDELMQKVQQNSLLVQQLAMYQQMALQLAQQHDPALAEQLANSIMTGAAEQQGGGRAEGAPVQLEGDKGGPGGNMTKLSNARERSRSASRPR